MQAPCPGASDEQLHRRDRQRLHAQRPARRRHRRRAAPGPDRLLDQLVARAEKPHRGCRRASGSRPSTPTRPTCPPRRRRCRPSSPSTFPARRQNRTVVQGDAGGAGRARSASPSSAAHAPTTSCSTARSCSAEAVRQLPLQVRLPGADVTIGRDPAGLRALPAPGHLHADPQARGPQRPAASTAARRELEVPAVEGEAAAAARRRDRAPARRGQRRALDARDHDRDRAPRGEMQSGLVRFDTLDHRPGDRARSASRSTASRCCARTGRPTRSSSTSARCRARARCAPTAYDAGGRRARLRRDADQRQRAPLRGAPGRAARGPALREEPARRGAGRAARGREPRAGRVLAQRDAGRDALPGAVHPADRAAAGGGRSPTCAPSPTRPTATRPRTWSSSTRRRTSRSSTSSSSSCSPPCSTATTGRSPTCPRATSRVFEDGVAAAARPLRAGREPAGPRRRCCSTSRPRWSPTSREAKPAALKLFEEAIQPSDRAALIPFNDRPNLAGQADQPDRRPGRRPRRPEGRARHLALRRGGLLALLLQRRQGAARAASCSPTARTRTAASRFEQTLDFARRAGVAIYTIGLGIGRAEFETRKVLDELADETGGRAFFIKEATELAADLRGDPEGAALALPARLPVVEHVAASRSSAPSRSRSPAPASRPRRCAATTPEPRLGPGEDEEAAGREARAVDLEAGRLEPLGEAGRGRRAAERRSRGARSRSARTSARAPRG